LESSVKRLKITIFYQPLFSDISGRDANRDPPRVMGNDVRAAVEGARFVAGYFKDQEESSIVSYGVVLNQWFLTFICTRTP